MPRVKRGMTAHRRHKRVLAMVKGHMTSRGHLYKMAHQEMMKSLMYAYRDRRSRKRETQRHRRRPRDLPPKISPARHGAFSVFFSGGGGRDFFSGAFSGARMRHFTPALKPSNSSYSPTSVKRSFSKYSTS